MIKKLLTLFAVMSTALVGASGPVEAHRGHHALTGDMSLVLNAGLGIEDNPTADVSWVGTWDLGTDGSYDIAFFSIVPPTDIGDTGWAYWIEDVALYDTGSIEVDDSGTVREFDRDAYVMYGHDRGIGNFESNFNVAVGSVTGVHPRADDYRRFHRNDIGNLLTFTGGFAGPTEFVGTFTVYGVR